MLLQDKIHNHVDLDATANSNQTLKYFTLLQINFVYFVSHFFF